MRHYACAILKREGKILLGQRAAHRKAYPLCWDVIGGRVEEGETLEEALHRELGEEIGIAPTSYEILASVVDNGPQERGEATYHMYLVQTWTGGEPTMMDHEHTEHDQGRLRSAQLGIGRVSGRVPACSVSGRCYDRRISK